MVRSMVQERVRVERRLSAILAADVAGYSRLMHNDEEATHAKLTALLARGVVPAIAQHGGRIVKNTGDGIRGSDRANRPTYTQMHPKTGSAFLCTFKSTAALTVLSGGTGVENQERR